MRELYISKFGGTSMVHPVQVKKIVLRDTRRRIVVVSAPGKRFKDDIKVTDLLIDLAKTKKTSTINEIAQRYDSHYPGSGKRVFSLVSERVFQNDEDSIAYSDSIKALGEELSAREFAQFMGTDWIYVDPKGIIVLSNEYGAAQVLPETYNNIASALKLPEKGGIIFPGFFGYTKDGNLATFARGGSDKTQTVLAKGLKIGGIEKVICENFTDSSVLCAHPDIVPNPLTINEITFDELRDLSYNGFDIFHPEAVIPAKELSIPIYIKGTMNPDEKGTCIMPERLSNFNNPLVGISYKDNFCSIDVEVKGTTKDILINILEVLKKNGISVEYPMHFRNNTSIVINNKNLDDRYGIIKKIESALDTDATVRLGEDNLCSVVVAGKGIKGNRGISGKIQTFLANNGINIKFMSGGTDERCIIYGIEKKDGAKAANSIYDHFFRNNNQDLTSCALPRDEQVSYDIESGYCAFHFMKDGFNEQVGGLIEILKVFKKENIPVEDMPCAVDDVTFVVEEKHLVGRNIHELMETIAHTFGNGGRVTFEEHLSRFLVYGKGLKENIGIAAKIQLEMANGGVNIVSVSQPPTEIGIVYYVKRIDEDKIRSVFMFS
jgi:aspartate kinase